MKNKLKFGVLLFAGALPVWGAGVTFAVAQEEQAIKCDKVPASVTTAFKTTYPKATIHDCSKEIEKGKVAYEISSLEDKTRRDILYHEDGAVSWLRKPSHPPTFPSRSSSPSAKNTQKGQSLLPKG